jgi:uncharacterized membrane protein
MSEPAKPAEKSVCAITGRPLARRDLMAVDALRPALADRIRQDHPELALDALIGREQVARYRTLYVEDLLARERGELTDLDRQVADSMANHETLAENTEDTYADTRTLGERLADKIADFGGSWTFILIFLAMLGIWMAINAAEGEAKAFDPYPFILLNLVLSCVAALQAPVIMMSQKRQEEKDRLRAENDYRVNLKAELEIRHLHEKMDYMISKQWQRLTEIQQIQLEIMQERGARR